MLQGAEEFKRLFEAHSDRPILLYGDPDMDGLISLLFMCQFCDMMGKKYSYYVNPKRAHGFFLNPKDLHGYLIIAADFTIEEFEIKDIVDNDIVILSTDHHDFSYNYFVHYINEETRAEGIAINNQYLFEPEEDRYLSGAGVFYELICSIYPEFKSDVREALVGITLLSDIRPIENAKARYYLKKTYGTDTRNNYLGYLLEMAMDTVDYGFGVPRLDRNFIDYNLSPLVNSLLRFDKENTATELILGGGISTSDKSIRKVQTALVAEMKAKANILHLDNVTFIGVGAEDYGEHFPGVDVNNFIGLLCNSIKGNGKSVLGFVYNREGKVTRASFRGRYADVLYREGLAKLGLQAEGHSGAFGVLNFAPSKDTWVQIDEIVGELDSNHKPTISVYEAGNLSFLMMQKGMELATDNTYVRDMYRSYIKYTGINAKIIKESFKSEPFTSEDLAKGLKPDLTTGGLPQKYVRDSDGNMIHKYIEYNIDGKSVKSFGVKVEDGLILPILERGHIKLYVKEAVN